MNTLNLIKKEGYTIVQMNRGKVNALNHEMVQELRQAFRDIENDDQVQGAILTGQPHYFSAGLDLIELYEYDHEQIKGFFRDFGALYIELMQITKPIIAAITGHAPAGGCVLAVTCDNRFMADGNNYVIGLNEVAVNIQISQNLIETYAFWIGHGLCSRYVLEGKLLNGTEALSAGLIDELVPLDRVLLRAEAKMQKYMEADQEILLNTKNKLRKNLLDKLDVDAENSLKEAVILWWKPQIRKKMQVFVQQLATKNKR